jgi:hypothetical protein
MLSWLKNPGVMLDHFDLFLMKVKVIVGIHIFMGAPNELNYHFLPHNKG